MKSEKLFQQITDQVVASLENAKQWDKPWTNVLGDNVPHNGRCEAQKSDWFGVL